MLTWALECMQVALVPGESTCLALHIPMEAAENRNELEQFQERQQKRQKLKEEGSAAADVLPKVCHN